MAGAPRNQYWSRSNADNNSRIISTLLSMKKQNNFIRFLSYVRPYWLYILLGAIGGVVKFTVPLLVPQATRYLLDSVYLNPMLTTSQKLHQLFVLVGGLLAIFVFFWAPWTYVRHYFTAKGGRKAVFDLRADLYYHILRMSSSFFQRNQSGSIVARLISDIQLAQNLVGSALTNVWMDMISIIVIIVFLVQINVPITLVALSTLPFYIYAFKKLQGKIRVSTHQVQDEIAAMSGNVQEKIAGSVVVRAFTQEKYEEQNFLRDSERLFFSTMRQAYYHSLNMTISGGLIEIAPLIVTLFGGYQVIQGYITVGELVAVGLYLGPLYMPIRRFSELNVVFANSMAALDRIFEIVDQEPEIQNRPNAIKLEKIEGHVQFDRVHFAYKHTSVDEPGPVLSDISFSVEPGQKAALVGPSGSGKSTLVSLIPRFFEVQAGSVCIDGYDIREVKIKSLRRHIGMVLQDAILFSGTILENLHYGNPQAGQQEVIAACRAANAYEFIQALPDNFDTEVGEGGAFLSGGQKQRLTIARAFLKDPKILILDEATSALDAESEQLIQAALQQLMVGRTAFIIAHRLSTIVNADKIFVLDAGKIVEQGTHAELLKWGGVYYHLYQQQFASAISANV
jgi:ABC-type multidrug transport system fused ATPase/permease subunit